MNKKRIRKLVLSLVVSLAMVSVLGSVSFADEVDLDLTDPVAVSDEEVLVSEDALQEEPEAASETADEIYDPAESYIHLLEDQEVFSGDSYDFTDEESQQLLLAEAENYPAKYDMREKRLITPVKLQNPFGSCWVFSAIAAAESSILSSGLAEEIGLDASTLNLSERHLSYFTATPIKDIYSPQYGEGYKDNGVSASKKLSLGGYSFLASTVMANGAGPVLENDDPDLIYMGRNGNIDKRYFGGALQDFSYSASDDWEVPYERRFDQDFILKESYVLPTPAGEDENGQYSYNEAAVVAIKKQLIQGKAVNIGFLADQASPDQTEITPIFLSDKWAHYSTIDKMANHAVTIVGWDDDYSTDNFIKEISRLLTVHGL